MEKLLNRLRAFKKSYVRSEYSGDTYNIHMSGEIGTEYNMISFDKFKNSVDEDLMEKAEDIQLFLDCPGGLIDEGDKIYNFLANYKDKLDVIVNGGALSMGSIIAIAGRKTYMTRPSEFMIHLPHLYNVTGNSEDLAEYSDEMRKYNRYFVNIYKEKCGKPEEELLDKLKKETWFSATQAVNYGFADDIWYGEKQFNLPLVAKSHLDDETLNKILTKNLNTEIEIMLKHKNKNLLKLKALKAEYEKEEKEVSELIDALDDSELEEDTVMETEEKVEDEAVAEETVVEEEIEAEAPVEDGSVAEIAEEVAVSIETLHEVIEILSDAEGVIDGADMKAVFAAKEKNPNAYTMKAYQLGKKKLAKMKVQLTSMRFNKIFTKPKMMVASDFEVAKHDSGVPKFKYKTR